MIINKSIPESIKYKTVLFSFLKNEIIPVINNPKNKTVKYALCFLSQLISFKKFPFYKFNIKKIKI